MALIGDMLAGRRFHAVGYEHRIISAAVLMSSSYVTIAVSSTRPWQLLGVALGSLQASSRRHAARSIICNRTVCHMASKGQGPMDRCCSG